MEHKRRIINLFGGPGTGKSIIMAMVFAELKFRGQTVEMAPEFVKGAAWEGRGEKFWKAQKYILGHQTFIIDMVIDEVDFCVTDSPILQNLLYIDDDYPTPSIKETIKEYHDSIESVNILLERTKPYDPKGRKQTFFEAKDMDDRIVKLLADFNVEHRKLPVDRATHFLIIDEMKNKGWFE